MSLKKKWMFVLIIAAVLMNAATLPAYAMHIMEGYLPPIFSAAWSAAALPFLIWGFMAIRKILERDRGNITLLAMSGAFIFVISSLKIPSVTGSCSHMTGTGLGAMLFGPAPAAVLGVIVLLFQAVLLAHGGLTTLGANTFSMAVAGPIAAYFLYRGCRKAKMKKEMAVFAAAFAGDLVTYCVTSLQLALAYPAADGGLMISAVKFLGVFAPTQLPLAILEGILTMLIMMALDTYAAPELKLLGVKNAGKEEP